MKMHFKISYFTHWGQELRLVGNIPELGLNDINHAAPIHYDGGGLCSLVLETPLQKDQVLRYHYILADQNLNLIEEEWGDERQKKLTGAQTTQCIDAWRSNASIETALMTPPFTKVLLKAKTTPLQSSRSNLATHHFSVFAPLLQQDEIVCLLGNSKTLGEWHISSPLLLSLSEKMQWEIRLDLSQETGDIQYKYGIYNTKDQAFVRFEEGSDRIVPGASPQTFVEIEDAFLNMPNQTWHGAGTCIPVFSLRSNRSFGCGDFTDLKLMADWTHRVGLKLIQVLPLNDTVGTHSEDDVLPYAAISAFALNPLFVDLELLGLPTSHALYKEYKRLQPQLNKLPLMDYMTVIDFKLKYLNAAYLSQKEAFLQSKAFKAFKKENEHWLLPYALYCCLRDKKGTCDYRLWDEFSHYSPKFIEEYVYPKHPWFDAIAVNWFIQFHLDKQLKNTVAYCHSKDVIVKGDIPIGVNQNSVDTWVSPELFHMDMQAGAPPDMFATKGQNWELPTYNWSQIKATGFDWWKKRFEQMAHYFDSIRIDHILGFFRIWQIPTHEVEGIMGYLNPSVPIYRDELEGRGVSFDYERFCTPYITDELLEEKFGVDADFVRQKFLYIKYGFAYRIKDEYSSQKSIEDLCKAEEISEKIQYGLFDLISNVLLFPKENTDSQEFYPRYGMQDLSTYKALDSYQQQVFNELYINYFYQRQDDRWYRSGLEKLPALKSSCNMLICGEDLGMMTHCVSTLMHQLSILSLEVQRAPKTDQKEFSHPNEAPYLSVVTPSTHDMSTIRGWWEEKYDVSQRFYNQVLGHWGEAPYFGEWWICRDIILQHLYSPAMWSIFQWQDLMSISPELRRENPHEERINDPSNSKASWRYRMHLTLEELLKQDEFNDTLKGYIIHSGR